MRPGGRKQACARLRRKRTAPSRRTAPGVSPCVVRVVHHEHRVVQGTELARCPGSGQEYPKESPRSLRSAGIGCRRVMDHLFRFRPKNGLFSGLRGPLRRNFCRDRGPGWPKSGGSPGFRPRDICRMHGWNVRNRRRRAGSRAGLPGSGVIVPDFGHRAMRPAHGQPESWSGDAFEAIKRARRPRSSRSDRSVASGLKHHAGVLRSLADPDNRPDPEKRGGRAAFSAPG